MCGCQGPGHVEGAIGPELAQAAAVRRNTHVGLMSGAQGQGDSAGPGDWEADGPAIHQGADGVRLAHLIDPDAVDVSTGWQLLPGRVVAAAAWDGEPGPTAPVQVG